VNVFFYTLIFTLNHRRPKMSKFDTSDKKFIETIFLKMPHLSPMQTARAIAKLEENWSLAAVARELKLVRYLLTRELKLRRRLNSDD
jgi:dsRNA-specific ribonuclease